MFLEIKLTHFEHSVGKTKKKLSKSLQNLEILTFCSSPGVCFHHQAKLTILPANVLFFLHQIDNQALAAAFIFVCHPMGENLLLARREQLWMHFFSNISDKKGWEKNNNLVPENRYYVCTSLSTPLMRAW